MEQKQIILQKVISLLFKSKYAHVINCVNIVGIKIHFIRVFIRRVLIKN